MATKRSRYVGVFLIGILILVILWSLRRGVEGFQTAGNTATLPTFLATKCRRTSFNVTSTGAAIDATATTASGGATWLCSDDTSASRLVRGDMSFTPPRPYMQKNDSVCVVQDIQARSISEALAKNATFACKDLSNEEDDYTKTLYDNYDATCANFAKGYLDLSNNLTNLINIRDTIQDQKDVIVDAGSTFTKMLTDYKCAEVTNPSQKIICEAITNARGRFGVNQATVTDILNKVITPVSQALNSRITIAKNALGFTCSTEVPCDLFSTVELQSGAARGCKPVVMNTINRSATDTQK